ncbi:2-dehydro-3-deoxyglucarate aldolase [Escherichia coli]|uniref:2-dehydro-3-deoxyglucarate aldolase n=1 Tax=Escherichia coli TaxID=562 RepID=A0A377D8T4_ECOLX|nr:2-dehydro-3-deoxyglucarate aldolase [Escherichia coli]
MPRTRMYKKQSSIFFNRASAHGKPSGILAPVEADARRYLEWGATFVAVGSDLGVFRSATQKLADTFKK